MIIKRRYASFGALLKDPLSKQAMINSIKNTSKEFTDEKAESILVEASWIIFYQADLGCGIPGNAYRQMQEKFEELDKTDPFDNGLTYNDVTRVLTFPSRRGNAMMQWLIRNETADLNAEIIQIIAFEKDGQGIKAIEPWKLEGEVYF